MIRVYLLDDHEAQEEVPPGAAQTASEVLGPDQEEQAEEEAEDLEQRAELVSHERLDGES